MPDMITMAKALTNGSQPMGAVAVSDRIYRALTAGSPPEAIELFHGYTFSAHPAACAAALATLDIYAGEELFTRAAALSGGFLDRMFSLADIPVITDIRGYGMLAAFDMAPAAAPGARGFAALKRLFEAGLLIKWTGDTGIVAPALIASDSELDEIEEKLRRVLETI
jgi:beta-alanine--pyruvate transaminase